MPKKKPHDDYVDIIEFETNEKFPFALEPFEENLWKYLNEACRDFSQYEKIHKLEIMCAQVTKKSFLMYVCSKKAFLVKERKKIRVSLTEITLAHVMGYFKTTKALYASSWRPETEEECIPKTLSLKKKELPKTELSAEELESLERPIRNSFGGIRLFFHRIDLFGAPIIYLNIKHSEVIYVLFVSYRAEKKMEEDQEKNSTNIAELSKEVQGSRLDMEKLGLQFSILAEHVNRSTLQIEQLLENQNKAEPIDVVATQVPEKDIAVPIKKKRMDKRSNAKKKFVNPNELTDDQIQNLSAAYITFKKNLNKSDQFFIKDFLNGIGQEENLIDFSIAVSYDAFRRSEIWRKIKKDYSDSNL